MPSRDEEALGVWQYKRSLSAAENQHRCPFLHQMSRGLKHLVSALFGNMSRFDAARSVHGIHQCSLGLVSRVDQWDVQLGLQLFAEGMAGKARNQHRIGSSV
ncbi:MAG: hypothetical protein ABT05_07465 [Lautropia sp. SCN 66-9]|nr:MAG: hypothetical protein ABT05_07465 [Lautropia sp. SCN 66-9]